jgi:hypothetical protein
VPFKLTDKGKGELAKRGKSYAQSGRIGIQGSKASAPHGQGKGQTIGEIAAEHELGLGVPQRSFLRVFCDQNDKEIRTWLKAAALKIELGASTPDREVGLICARIQAGVQEFIANGQVEPPNAPATIARKKSSTPLIDTGQLRSAITWELEQIK